MTPHLKAIDHVHITVTDRTAAARWYEKTLGLTRATALAFWATGGGPLTIQNHDGSVHLALFEGAPQTRSATVAFEVDANEFLRWQAHLGESMGVWPQAEDHAVSWSLYFDDPDGNPFEITSYAYDAIARELAARRA